jgi:hypothetical protein
MHNISGLGLGLVVSSVLNGVLLILLYLKSKAHAEDMNALNNVQKNMEDERRQDAMWREIDSLSESIRELKSNRTGGIRK